MRSNILAASTTKAEAAAVSGTTIITPAALERLVYNGLLKPEELSAFGSNKNAYLRRAKANGIQLALGYVCATSIVKLETLDRNLSKEFRARFTTPPAPVQKDRDGKSLPSCYGGNYRPAWMNNPDWRAYEKFIIRLQIESGHDGIFFGNPTDPSLIA